MKMTDRVKALYIEQLRKTPIIQIACEKVNISRATFYRWKADDPEFGQKVDDAQIEGRLMVNDLAESMLIRGIKEANMGAITYWLKHHHGDYKNRVEISGTIGVVRELTPEQKDLIRRALELANVALGNTPYEQPNAQQPGK